MKSLAHVLRLLLTTPSSNREVGRRARISHNTARRYRERLQDTGLAWDSIKDLDDEALDTLLNDGRRKHHQQVFLVPDWSLVHADMQKRSVTVSLLHVEYLEAMHGRDGGCFSLTTFQRRYKRYKRSLGLMMRQVHRAGEKAFLDYAGDTVWLTDPSTGTRTTAQVFVATLGASRLIYAEATLTQSLPDWIGANVRMLRYFGGVPEILVPDNLKSAVTKVSWRDGPLINATYNELAVHYYTEIVPAPPRNPKAKAMVEVSEQIVQRWILARLRNHTFYSLAELNEAIARLLEDVNNRPMRKLGDKTRRELYEELDRPALKPLPVEAYEFAEWRIGTKVGPDYCVTWAQIPYSVPSQLVGARVNVKAKAQTIDVFRNGKLTASHPRRSSGGPYILKEHMPPAHREYASEDGSQLFAWAEAAGPSIAEFVQRHRAAQRPSNTAFQACRGLKALARHVGLTRLDAACRRALALKAISMTSVRSTLHHGLENRPLPARPTSEGPPIDHENVRGADYFK